MSEAPQPVPLRRDPQFQPCATEPGDELYPNGIFEFNISRLITTSATFHDAHAVRCFRSLGEQIQLFAYGSPYRIDEVPLEASGIRGRRGDCLHRQ